MRKELTSPKFSRIKVFFFPPKAQVLRDWIDSELVSVPEDDEDEDEEESELEDESACTLWTRRSRVWFLATIFIIY